MRDFKSVVRAVVAQGIFLLALVAIVLVPMATAQGNLPPASVYARAYAYNPLIGQQANTFTFNGNVCNYAPYNQGFTPSFFIFSGYQASTAVYYPVAILDANPTLSEIVTPTSTVSGASTCGFSAAPVNQHISFQLQSGTAGLQESIVTQQQSSPVFAVLLDKFWYQQVAALPGAPLPETLIKAATGNTNVTVADTTTTPWTYWRWTGTAYAALSLTGGTSAPTAAAGAAAGTSPTGPTNTGDGNQFSVALTTGTATTTGTLFTETWATSGAFTFPPTCNVYNTGTNTVAITATVTYPSATHALLTVAAATGVTPAISTAYAFRVICN